MALPVLPASVRTVLLGVFFGLVLGVVMYQQGSGSHRLLTAQIVSTDPAIYCGFVDLSKQIPCETNSYYPVCCNSDLHTQCIGAGATFPVCEKLLPWFLNCTPGWSHPVCSQTFLYSSFGTFSTEADCLAYVGLNPGTGFNACPYSSSSSFSTQAHFVTCVATAGAGRAPACQSAVAGSSYPSGTVFPSLVDCQTALPGFVSNFCNSSSSVALCCDTQADPRVCKPLPAVNPISGASPASTPTTVP
jgi:hypothetical protein